MKFRSDLADFQTIVIKLGSNVVASGNSGLKVEALASIVQDIAALHHAGKNVAIVSSGSIACGSKLVRSLETVTDLQVASSVGQPYLFSKYQELFAEYNINLAQILLTQEDFSNRKRSLNLQKTIGGIFSENIIPVINENDAVAYAEITVGDNDHLASMLVPLISADLMLLISSADGVYTLNPEASDSKVLDTVNDFAQLQGFDFSSQSSLGRGGMSSKVKAVKKVFDIGVDAIIAGKNYTNPVKRALSEKVGTIFKSPVSYEYSRKAWLRSIVRTAAQIEIKADSVEAIRRHASLLAIGIISVQGEFNRGDCVNLVCDGREIALGIVDYSAESISKIKGCYSEQIIDILGFYHGDEVIHRNNLLVYKEN